MARRRHHDRAPWDMGKAVTGEGARGTVPTETACPPALAAAPPAAAVLDAPDAQPRAPPCAQLALVARLPPRIGPAGPRRLARVVAMSLGAVDRVEPVWGRGAGKEAPDVVLLMGVWAGVTGG